MELGNMLSGCSQGEFGIPRFCGFEEQFERLILALSLALNPSRNGYNFVFQGDSSFENEVFTVRSYYWGDCACGHDDVDEECEDGCKLMLPNFLYKPTGYSIKWYKYPFRAAYQSQNLRLDGFSRIIDDCLKSLAT